MARTEATAAAPLRALSFRPCFQLRQHAVLPSSLQPLSTTGKIRLWSFAAKLAGRKWPVFSLRSSHSLPNAVGHGAQDGDGGVNGNAAAKRNELLHVVLVSPQIAGNTGCIARTCAASAVRLHLVEPLGYKVDDAKLKRAGLDYWPYVVVKIHSSWSEFRKYFLQQEGENRLLAFTKKGTKIHSDISYKPGDWLVFGSETSGLPPEALLDCNSVDMGGGTIRIPMVETYVRCLNLSVSVGIALYEASRQLNYEQLQQPIDAGTDTQRLFISEDIYG